VRRQEGFALPLALCALVTIGLLVATVSFYASRNATSAKRAIASQKARALADAGLNSALSVLESAGDPSVGAAVPAGAQIALDGGTYSYTATLNGSVWTLVGTGRYPAQQRGAVKPVTRTTSLDVNVVRQPILDIWQYLYSDTLTGCMFVANNAVIAAPLYVRGNLCIGNNGHITGSPLQVGGTLTVNNQASVGYSNAPINIADLAGGCTGAAVHPCTSADDVYARTINRSVGNLTKPPYDANWYYNATLGPRHGCTTGSVPGGFDNDSTANGTRPVFDLTPATGYDCRAYDANGNLVGQLTWVPGYPAGHLTIAGVIFFDGPVQMINNAFATYSGRATIYSSRTILLDNNAYLCGVAACDATWDPNTNLLIFVSGEPTGYGFTLSNNSIFQGGAYVVSDYSLVNNSVNWGPVIAHQLAIANNAGQTKPVNSLPPGAPADFTTSLQVAPETYR
jgi:hypothetical protein